MNTPELWFSVDDLDILKADRTNVYLRGLFAKTKRHKPTLCIIVMSRDLLHHALEYWIEEKCRFEFGEGKGGKVLAITYRELEETRTMWVDEPGKTYSCESGTIRSFTMSPKTIPVFEMTVFHNFPYMRR